MNANEIAYALNAPINKDDVPNEYLFEEIQEEKDGLFSKKALAEKGHVSQGDIAALLDLFENAKTFGSLIQVPPKLAGRLSEIEKRLDDVLTHGDLTHASAHVLKPLLEQARLLARQYDAVVANPPYMGSKAMSVTLKKYIAQCFPIAKSDLFSAFVIRCITFTGDSDSLSFVTPYVWMFLSSYESFRESLLSSVSITSLTQLEYNAFEPACVPVCIVALSTPSISGFSGTYINLSEFKGHASQSPRTIEAIASADCPWRFIVSQDELVELPGKPIAYWLAPKLRQAFKNYPSIGDVCSVGQGSTIGDNERFLKLWYEIDYESRGTGFLVSKVVHSGAGLATDYLSLSGITMAQS